MAKDSDPGMLDNMVAGGLSAGESIEACLWRECWEEAGLDHDNRQQIIDNEGLKPLRVIHIQCMEALTTAWPYLRRERLYAFSLSLPQGFVPVNQDGEVSAYHCVDRKGLTQRIDDAALTQDAALVASLWL
jgi:8-oxo-dGTP pyrophosphatase MutT (NUDIX family)